MPSNTATCQPHQDTTRTMSETADLDVRPQKVQTISPTGSIIEQFSPQLPPAYPQPRATPEVDSSASSTLPPPKLLSTHLAKHPNHTVGKAIRTNFPRPNPLIRLIKRFRVKHSVIEGLTEQEMRKCEERGEELRRKAGWRFEGEKGEGTVVSQLFWKMYISLLPTLDRDPLSGLVPPDLLGSTTTMPLSIISLIPDIMQHYRDVIVRAKKEVFLATNYWQPSNSVNTISQALRDLSARVLKEGRPKVVVKIMYDRGSWEQLWNAHAPVRHSEWTPLDLPAKEDTKGLDMEVINFHKVLLGTFHAKFLIVDRKVALINSNNIQDRPNLELMSHFEGPVVDAFYEIALHSWYNRLNPPLPCMTKPYEPPRGPDGKVHYLFQDQNPYFDDIEILKAAKAARILLRRQTKDNAAEAAHHEGAGERLREAVRKVVDQQRQSLADWKPGEEFEARAQTAMKELREFKDRWSLGMGMMGTGSRANSRGPSRRPSKEKHRDEEKTRTLLAPSEGNSSPTFTAELPPRSKTYPHPNDTTDDVWNPRILSDGIHRESESDVIARHSPDGGCVAEENVLSKKHVCFAPLEMKGVDGMGKIFPDAGITESPNTTTTHLPLQTSQSVSSNCSPIENIAPQTGFHIQNSTIPEEDATYTADTIATKPAAHAASKTDSPCTSESQTREPPTSETNETLPLSAQMPDESGETYEKTKKHLEMDIPQEGNAGKPKKEGIRPEGTGSNRMFQLSKKFNAGALSDAWATVEDSDELDNFRPHVVHAPHDPFPIAMCCRKPHGLPGHHDIRNPQNAAWLAGFRYAKKKVFVQTPTLNARPIVRAIKQACRRGVAVVLLLDLGFNDKGESIPFQGGTNEEVVDRLYKKLSLEKKEQYLKVYWYTGKDQVRPLNAVKKQRNCHIKFAAYDDEVMIIGNGNQDSQSWFHSQEVNVMIDSKQIVAEMMDTLLSNQNTIKYGLVSSDGIWRDKDGHTLEHYGATAKGAFRGLSGFIAFAKSI
ncbi:hypothetical protein C366_02346 [Cryptococcus neoformans Tu401-1]|nr:hypothetical protein C365_02489 [Cryptococcus neoformans var. grubii Bt85]OXG19497.1 hypothetical protein C366_02346 [Cryptococcus neoformans var. grubii Tu401-1]